MYISQNSIGKGHSCHSLSIVNLFSRRHIPLIRGEQMILQSLCGFNCECIGKNSPRLGHISFYTMRHCIHSTISNHMLRHLGNQNGINDSNVRSKSEICQWIFNSCLLICNYGKIRNLRSCAAGCWNSYEFGFGPEFRQRERDSSLFKSQFRILIK
ncbi:hypothetical protein D3C73_1280470 [compost metagenome]